LLREGGGGGGGVLPGGGEPLRAPGLGASNGVPFNWSLCFLRVRGTKNRKRLGGIGEGEGRKWPGQLPRPCMLDRKFSGRGGSQGVDGGELVSTVSWL